jgi:hypothetical protein
MGLILMNDIPCKRCNHLFEHHGQFHLVGGWERSCTGAGTKWFSKENKCKCWIYQPVDNLSYIEKLAKERNLI